jgi:hypothetical protein
MRPVLKSRQTVRVETSSIAATSSAAINRTSSEPEA